MRKLAPLPAAAKRPNDPPPPSRSRAAAGSGSPRPGSRCRRGTAARRVRRAGGARSPRCRAPRTRPAAPRRSSWRPRRDGTGRPRPPASTPPAGAGPWALPGPRPSPRRRRSHPGREVCMTHHRDPFKGCASPPALKQEWAGAEPAGSAVRRWRRLGAGWAVRRSWPRRGWAADGPGGKARNALGAGQGAGCRRRWPVPCSGCGAAWLQMIRRSWAGRARSARRRSGGSRRMRVWPRRVGGASPATP